jgi:hypothetical protein
VEDLAIGDVKKVIVFELNHPFKKLQLDQELFKKSMERTDYYVDRM